MKLKRRVCLGLFAIPVFFACCAACQSYAVHYAGTELDPLPINNEDDLNKLSECTRVNKNWSRGKHVSLNCDLELEAVEPLSGSGDEHCFNGTFHGNNHTITIKGSGALFGQIGESGSVENLRLKGNCMLANDNKGDISGCHVDVTASYGIAGSNSGSISHCNVTGTFSAAGIVGTNSGRILQCYVGGDFKAFNRKLAGITNYNTRAGLISGCKVEANFDLTLPSVESMNRYPFYERVGSTSLHASQNEGTIENCS